MTFTRNEKAIVAVYFLVSIVEIFAAILNWQPAVLVLKPLLMPILAVLVYKTHKQLLLPLFFSWLGDVFLMFEGQLFFLLGLGSFLMAQLSYIFIFGKGKVNAIGRILLLGHWLGMIFMLKPHLVGVMFVAVLCYASVITFMGIRGIESQKKWVGLGALFFIASDTLLAYNKFISPVPLASLWVMGTYVLAQFFIVIGIIKNK